MAVLYTTREAFYSGRKDEAIANMASAGIGGVAPSRQAQSEEKSSDYMQMAKDLGL